MEVNSELVRVARTERGWTQQQLAEIADLSLRTVQRVENQSAASQETISSLCAVLELDRRRLLAIDLERPEHLRAVRRAQWLMPVAVAFGALLGSGATLTVMWWLGS
ncbi:helix-turn-helix domain-containing protein [Wenzhouxiangella marina]|uniref:XRE family transcriptional regulator n=1 Tax=Wenzhouxiangella marina TaxID=1579979 RepID=A0A0K0XV86_9GAMM|nr:helix-turn-helix transcriptional regulator [Wenzhouxiangella marina]AKS41580.1 XRE family transcriptional regulator [Wenzhouxiangella marina]MBB6086661.1 transcriptional regulator with XRE-family HTH domain [Wenzhouxiangella marina]